MSRARRVANGTLTSSVAAVSSSDGVPCTKNCVPGGHLAERLGGEPQGPRQQPIVERAFLLQALEDALTHLGNRQAGELGIEVIGGLGELGGLNGVQHFDHLVGDVTRAADHHDQDPTRVQRDQVHVLEGGVLTPRCNRESHVMGGPRQLLRDVLEQLAHAAGATQPSFQLADRP